jgi:hypothetical protein
VQGIVVDIIYPETPESESFDVTEGGVQVLEEYISGKQGLHLYEPDMAPNSWEDVEYIDSASP